MKKFCLYLMMLLCLECSLISCQEVPDSPQSELFYEWDFQDSSRRYYAYGSYIYSLNSSLQPRGIYRYHMETFECISACTDPECDGKCVIHEAHLLHGIRDGKLFFTTQATDTDIDMSSGRPNVEGTKRSHYAYLDLATGEVVVLRTRLGSQNIDVNSGEMEFDDSYIYYTVSLLREGGDPTVSDDYIPTYCRIPLSGGTEEVLFPKGEGGYEYALGICNGEIIVMRDDIICAYQIETGEFREIFNYEERGFSSRPFSFTLGNGKLYFFEKVGMIWEGTRRYYSSALIELELSTGEHRALIDERVFGYYIDHTGIYYCKTELREIPCPQCGEDYTINAQASPEFYRCDLNGENEEVIYRNENISLTMPNFIVAGDNLYAMISYADIVVYDEETGNYFKGTALRKIDTESGVITAPPDIE